MSAVPVVLVHGFMASPLLLRPMKRQLEKLGFMVYLVQLSPLAIQDIRDLAAQLHDNIERVCWVEDADEVDVVGVSLGGLTTLYYQHFVAQRRRIRRFIGLGSPFRGTAFARTWLSSVGKISPGIWQVLPDSELVTQLAEAGIPDGVTATSISMRGDQVSPPDSCHLEGADNLTLKGLPSPLTHQFLVASPVALRGIVAALRGERASES
ncbi:MAG: triacylglycerol lipase [Myxococcota bacterium]|jgi:triacylglycerol lipase